MRRMLKAVAAAGLVLLLAAQPAAAQKPPKPKKGSEEADLAGHAFAVLTKAFEWGKTIHELTTAKTSVVVKSPTSRTLDVHLGTTLTMPFEIDYSVTPATVRFMRTEGWYTCHFEVKVDGAVVRTEKRDCDKGLDMAEQQLHAVLARTWHCGRDNRTTVELRAWIENDYFADVWSPRWPSRERGEPLGGLIESVRRHDTVATATPVTVILKVYNPFFIEDFRIDPAVHPHHERVDSEAIVTVVKQKSDSATSVPGWTYRSTSSYRVPWKYFGIVNPFDTPHHTHKMLDEKEQVAELVPTELRAKMPHKPIQETHHETLKERFVTMVWVSGYRGLGEDQKVRVHWFGNVKEAPDTGVHCKREFRPDDIDPRTTPTPSSIPTTQPGTPTGGSPTRPPAVPSTDRPRIPTPGQPSPPPSPEPAPQPSPYQPSPSPTPRR